MERTVKYVVMSFYAPENKHYASYYIHVYSRKSSNKDAIIQYCHKVRQQASYKNNKNIKWYVLTEHQALEHSIKLHKWQIEQENKAFERRFPSRYLGRTLHEDLAEMMTNR